MYVSMSHTIAIVTPKKDFMGTIRISCDAGFPSVARARLVPLFRATTAAWSDVPPEEAANGPEAVEQPTGGGRPGDVSPPKKCPYFMGWKHRPKCVGPRDPKMAKMSMKNMHFRGANEYCDNWTRKQGSLTSLGAGVTFGLQRNHGPHHQAPRPRRY